MKYIIKVGIIVCITSFWSCKVMSETEIESNNISKLREQIEEVSIDSLTSLDCLMMLEKGMEIPFEGHELPHLYIKSSSLFPLGINHLLPCALEYENPKRDTVIVELMNKILDFYQPDENSHIIYAIFDDEEHFLKLRGEGAFLLFYKLLNLNIVLKNDGGCSAIMAPLSSYAKTYLINCIETIDGEPYYEYRYEQIKISSKNEKTAYNPSGNETPSEWMDRVEMEQVMDAYTTGKVIFRSDYN